jgi:molybdate transport system substrate-binding protein
VKRIIALWAILFLSLASLPALAADADKPPITVFAAASLTNVLQELGDGFTRETTIPVRFSFAASSALARQIESGAPADIFFSADLEWMDYLQTRNLIRRGSRHDVLGNRLVLIAPTDSTLKLKI